MDERDLGVSSVDGGEFYARYGEQLRAILNIESWQAGYDLARIYEEVAGQVEVAVRHEAGVRASLRDLVFPELANAADAPPNAGAYRVSTDQLKRIHHGLLFTGQVEGCDSMQHTLETLPVSVTQIGVSLVSYNGNQGTWMHRLFRRDLEEKLGDPAEEALSLLERRAARDRHQEEHSRDEVSRLGREAIVRYAERAILLRRSDAIWRIGHGRPVPFALLTGSAGSLDIMIEATRILEKLICTHQKFVFVPREAPGWLLRTLGAALQPMEYAIVSTLKEEISRIIEMTDYYLPTSSDTRVDGRRLTPTDWIRRFRDEIAPKVVVGVYRTSELAAPHVFYAHVDHAHEAAMIALADSALQPHRGFPTLLDLANHVCDATFGPDSLAAALQAGYTRAGAPLQYMTGRMGRSR